LPYSWIVSRMQSVLSHIVRKRLYNESEDVATTALCFVLESS
jgi:hypothetical protein